MMKENKTQKVIVVTYFEEKLKFISF